MKKIINIAKYIIINSTLLIIIYLIYLKGIRICLIYNLFKIPCPGCGLTTSTMYLLEGNIEKSLSYNIITIPLIFVYIVCSLWYMLDIIKERQTFKNILNKYKKYIIIVSIIIFIINFIRNITNPLLY